MAESSTRELLLDCVQVLSNYFQKVVMLRNVFCDDSQFMNITIEHLQEELGHNLLLHKDRNERPPVWDPILEATCSWFAWKMFTLNDEQKTLLIHLVLETSANIFFPIAKTALCKYRRIQYLQIHDIDEKHEQMGKELLVKDISPEKLERLFLVQQQGWDILNATCNRILSLTADNHPPLSN
ncbi:MAG TPA: hypothetical protein VG895_05580 [Patescibacteria group bacterium]|nr:hypothetical protein [Gammaproteobacteria bacterium]HWA52487.1 hypothetical protein [Patescibacteria group bacterium]